MRRECLLALVVLPCLLGKSAAIFIPIDDRIMMRGDANNSGGVSMSDATYINNYLYSGGPAPPCMNQADANDDGSVDGSDAVFILYWLYSGGPAPPAPGPFNTSCTADSDPNPGCANDPCP